MNVVRVDVDAGGLDDLLLRAGVPNPVGVHAA